MSASVEEQSSRSSNPTATMAVIVALITAALTGGVNWFVDSQKQKSALAADRQDKANAVATLLLTGLGRAKDGARRMISTKQALVYRTDVMLSHADKQALAFELSVPQLRSVTDAVLKIQQLWPAGARQAESSTKRSEQWRSDKALQSRAARTLKLTGVATEVLTPVAD